MKKLLVAFAGLLIAVSAIAQTDSVGIYSVRGASVQRVEILKYNQTKISGGLLNKKAKLQFDGAASQNRFAGSATFRLYFGSPSPYDVANYFMFTPSYSVKDFGVGKFEIKKGNRYLTTAKVSAFSSTIGAAKVEDIDIDTKQLRNGVYEITITGPVGEYCIMPILNGIGGYTGVFDFAIETTTP